MMKKGNMLSIIMLLSVTLIYGIEVEIYRVSDMPLVIQIDVFNDGEPPVEITDFHFSVSPPCMIVGASGPPGWTLRYGLPNTFVEMDAPAGGGIMPGGSGGFTVVLEGPCEGATYSFWLTSHGAMIPGTEREGTIPIPVNVDEGGTPEKLEITLSPNPFNSACAINVPARAKISVFDIRGNLVEEFSCGCSRTIWVWQPSKGTESGIYFIRADLPDDTRISRRAVYMK
jgi:hypothetical protein